MNLPPLPLLVLDTETTGFVPRVHRVIELATLRVENGQIVDAYEQLFSIPGEVPPAVQVLTRIKPTDLMGKSSFADQREEILKHLPTDCVLVGQNLGYDIGMLKGEGVDLSDRPWIDTSLLAALVFPELKSYSLAYLSTALHLNHEPAHRAMGDVRATIELLGKIWERLSELPPELLSQAKDIMERSTPGYRMLFTSLQANGTARPAWMKTEDRMEGRAHETQATIPLPTAGTVALQEEPLHPDSLAVLLAAAAKDKTPHWIAVKNLESALRKLPLPAGAAVLSPAAFLIDPEAQKRLLAQETFTAEEALLALKIQWFHPTSRSDLALHAGERDVWNGKLACTETSPTYTQQFSKKASAFLLDHRQLLSFLRDPTHAAHGALSKDTHIIIDDASMLEDTATKAYGHYCSLEDLRAAAQGNDTLMRLIDVLFLWAEKTRSSEDTHLLTIADVTRSETKGMAEQLSAALDDPVLPGQTHALLREVQAILSPVSFEWDIRWIEARPNGSLHLHSAPEHVDAELRRTLYEPFPVTLIVPEGSNGQLCETLPGDFPTQQIDPLPLPAEHVPIVFESGVTLAHIFQNPPPGRTIVLASSKRLIEQLFVQQTEALEAKGITLICQGMSGGQGRMEAEFLASTTPVLWLLTPWMYEGIELLEGGVDHLILECVPFDHPNHPVLARRKNHYRNAFEQYLLPRVEHRLFRLLRNFCRQRTEGGDVRILDQRLHERSYGVRIRSYVELIAHASASAASAKPAVKKKSKGGTEQPSLF